MKYDIEIRKRAEKDLSAIPKPDAQNIADAIFALENGLVGDIKKTDEFFSRISFASRKLADTFWGIEKQNNNFSDSKSERSV